MVLATPQSACSENDATNATFQQPFEPGMHRCAKRSSSDCNFNARLQIKDAVLMLR